MTRVALCVTCFEAVDPWSERGLFDLSVAFGRLSSNVEMVPFVRSGERLTDACNDLMADVEAHEKANGWRFDRVLWMDDDVCLITEDLPKLLRSVDDAHPVVFSLAFFRMKPYRVSMWRYALGPKVDGMRQKAELEFVANYPSDVLVPVHCAGLCAALFDRRVFDRVPKPYFAWVLDGYGQSPCTPDGYLCAKLVGAGVPLFCHTGVRTRHVGFPEIVDEALALRHKKEWVSA